MAQLAATIGVITAGPWSSPRLIKNLFAGAACRADQAERQLAPIAHPRFAG